MKKQITKKLINEAKIWLRDNGIKFFREIKERCGEVNAIWYEEDEVDKNESPLSRAVRLAKGNVRSVPHVVHFREGMQVRNFMRNSELCKNWNDHDFDDNWVSLIEECIR